MRWTARPRNHGGWTLQTVTKAPHPKADIQRFNHSLRVSAEPDTARRSGSLRRALCLVASQPRANTPLSCDHPTPTRRERTEGREHHPSQAHAHACFRHELGIAFLPLSPLLSTPEIPHQQAKRQAIPYRLSGQRATRRPQRGRDQACIGSRGRLPPGPSSQAGPMPSSRQGEAKGQSQNLAPQTRRPLDPLPALRGKRRTPQPCDSHQPIRGSTNFARRSQQNPTKIPTNGPDSVLALAPSPRIGWAQKGSWG